MTTKTLKEAVGKLGLTGEEKFSPAFQDELFNDYFLLKKRPDIGSYITGTSSTSLHAAQKATCLEWASVEDPDTPGHVYRVYEENGNRMHTRTASVALVLEEMRLHYQARVQEGLTPAEAWRATVHMGPGEHVQALRTHDQRASRNTLQHGAKGSAVFAYQRHLHTLGYKTADGRELAIDGHFGDDTRAATEAFQRDHGLQADGVAGKRTMAALGEAVSPPSIGLPDAPYLREQRPPADAPYVATGPAAESLAPYQAFAEQPAPGLPSVAVPVSDEPEHRPVVAAKDDVGLDPSGVQKLQEDLNTLGITNHRGEPLATHGQYGDETRMAVMGFQMDLGLPPSGVPDVATVALADARASLARMQPLRDLPMVPESPERERASAIEAPMPGREPSQATASMPFSDPAHPQHALYAELREQLPEEISETRLAQFTAACHKGGIGPGELEAIQIVDDRAVFVGGLDGYAEVNMSQTPSIEQSVQQAQAFDQQQSMEMNQRAQELQQAQGMSMSM